MPRKDPMLNTAQVAEMLGWSSAASVRAARASGYLPTPDDADEDTPANRRTVKWKTSTITKFMASRPGRGRKAATR